jgi:hypothetical protein
VKGTVEIVLRNTGLGTKLEALRATLSLGKPIETVADLHPIAISSAIKSFYSLLFTQGIGVLSHVDSLIAKELRAEARRDIGERLASTYEEIYRSINHLGVATHTPEQIRTLLDL